MGPDRPRNCASGHPTGWSPPWPWRGGSVAPPDPPDGPAGIGNTLEERNAHVVKTRSRTVRALGWRDGRLSWNTGLADRIRCPDDHHHARRRDDAIGGRER